MRIQRWISIFISIVILTLTINNSGKISYAQINLTEDQITSELLSKVGSNYHANYCLEFVDNFWESLGGVNTHGCCPHGIWDSMIVSTSIDNIPIGADVFFENSNPNSVICERGHICGHIGIYIGNGYMIEASNGTVNKTTIDYFNRGYWSYKGWGWHPGIITTPPQNISISSNISIAMVGDPMEFYYTINYANEAKGIGIDKDGKRYASIPVTNDSGTVKYTFTETGTYCVITEGRNSNGYACCDGIWIKVIEPTAPQNITISSANTTAMVGGTVELNYSIDYGYTTAGIGIDKDGKRYDTIPLHCSPGTEKYTFKEAGTYCIITEGSNKFGYNCCDGIWITVVEPTLPQNISIQSDNTTATVGGTMRFNYSINYAYDAKGVAIDKNGKRYATIPVTNDSGEVKYTFTEAGTYCVITEGRNSEGYACCDGIWITVVENNIPPQNLTISSNNETINKDETIELNYSIDYGYNTAFVIIEKNGEIYHKFSLNHSPGTLYFTFSDIGDYIIYTEGSNDNGYSKSDSIKIHVSIPGDCNADGKFNISDIVIFKKWLLGIPDKNLPCWVAADLCKDDRLDAFDLCLMRRKLIYG